jgi:tetratricopeptide (TPR) repeat protein
MSCVAISCVAGTATGVRAAPEPAPALPAPQAPSHVAADVEVERHAALGQRLLERGRTQEAIAEFRRAYELRAEPRFLFDIAEGYRLLGLRDQARFFYERYLAAAPDAPDREDVEATIASLGEPSPSTPSAPKPPAPSLAHDVVIVPVAVEPEAAAIWKRWWVWTAFGAIVAAGVATALLTREHDTAVPATALGDKRFY